MKAIFNKHSAALLTMGIALALCACGQQSDNSAAASGHTDSDVVSGQATTEWIALKSAMANSVKAKDESCLDSAAEKGLQADNLSNLGIYVIRSSNTNETPLQTLMKEGCIDSFEPSQGVDILSEDNSSGQAVTTWIAVLEQGKNLGQCLTLSRSFGLTAVEVFENLGIISFRLNNTDETPLERLIKAGCIKSFEREDEITVRNEPTSKN